MGNLYDTGIQKLDVADVFADALSAMPDTMDGQPPLPVPDVCPVALDELLSIPAARRQ